METTSSSQEKTVSNLIDSEEDVDAVCQSSVVAEPQNVSMTADSVACDDDPVKSTMNSAEKSSEDKDGEESGNKKSEEEKEAGEEVINVNQFYPDIDILTSSKLSHSNVAESEDHKFGGDSDESVPGVEPEGGDTQILALCDEPSLQDREEDQPPQIQVTVSEPARQDTPETQGFSVFVTGEEIEALPQSDWTISPEFDMVEIINSKASEHSCNAITHQLGGDLEAALRSINKAMSLRPNQSTHFIQRAEIFLQLTDFQSAILNYKKACFLEPDNNTLYERLAFIFYFQGQVFFDQRLFAEALESFSRASEMLPDKTGFHTRSIACLAALQRHGECLALVNKRLEVDKHNPDLYIMRARLHEMFGNMTLCYYDIKDALALDDEHEEALVLRSRMELKADENKIYSLQLSILGKNRESLQKMNIAIEMNPAIAEYHVLRGAVHRKLGDFNSAIDDFLLSLDKADHQEESAVYRDSQRQLLLTYNDFSIECFSKGYYVEAIILLNKALKGEKQEKGLYINRGDCFFRQGELTFALQDYHQALELDPRDTDVKSRISIIHSEFGVTAYHNKNYPEAESKMSLSIQYNPRVGQYYITRSRCRYLLEDMRGARTDLVMGLHLDPSNEEIISILSRLFPGKSVKEVMDSDLGRAARLALGHLSPMAAPVRLHPLPQTPALIPLPQETQLCGKEKSGPSPEPRKSTAFEMDTRGRPSKKQQPLNSPPSIQPLSQIVTEKKMMKSQLKTVLHDRQSLKYVGPRLKPLPPVTDTPMSNDRMNGLRQKSSTNWRKFNVGMGSLTAL